MNIFYICYNYVIFVIWELYNDANEKDGIETEIKNKNNIEIPDTQKVTIFMFWLTYGAAQYMLFYVIL